MASLVCFVYCDIPEVIKHNKTGLLAAERDVKGLVENLRLYIHHPEQWKSMLNAGRRHIETEYDARTQAKKLAAIYQEVVLF